MKKHILLSIICSFIICNHSSAQNWLWAQKAGGIDADGGNAITKDDFGNIYVTGGFSSSVINFGSFSLNNSGNFDLFIVKYNSLGNVLWATSAGGNNYDFGNSITTDA